MKVSLYVCTICPDDELDEMDHQKVHDITYMSRSWLPLFGAQGWSEKTHIPCDAFLLARWPFHRSPTWGCLADRNHRDRQGPQGQGSDRES